MRDLTQLALDTAAGSGASYADIRIITETGEDIAVRNEALGSLGQGKTYGFGVRVIADGAWGFAASSDVTADEIKAVAQQAVRIAKASATLKDKDVSLLPEPVHQDRWTTPITIDPFAVPLEDKVGLLHRVNAILRQKAEIKVAMGFMSFRRREITFASTEGSYIEQVLIRSGGGFAATAVGNGDSQTRSYPMSFRGQFQSLGYELIQALDLEGHAEQVREEAIALLTAPECPIGERDIILDPTQLFLQIHESVGHPTEFDRVLGLEANYAGRSFAVPEKVLPDGKPGFQYGSPIVNLIADGTLPTGLATRGYDDDGVATSRFHVVRDGVFQAWLNNREFGEIAGDERSRGCNRAMSFAHIPITRITNLHLAPGDWELDDLLADSEGALYLHQNKSWSIDQMRLNFQFGCEAAYEVKGGKLGTLYKNPSYQGITPTFWNSCDAICNDKYWKLVGTPNCGKGQPAQTAEMSHGCSPTRFRNVQVGIKSKDLKSDDAP